VLDRLLAEKLGDRVLMEVKGPLGIYGRIPGREIETAEMKKTIGIVIRFPEYQFRTTVGPVVRTKEEPPEISYLTPEEVTETARLIQESTGSYKQPYVLRIFEPESAADERMRSIGKLTSNDLLRHRSAARNFQVLTDIEKV
jgi:pyruvate formate lyase activating enzyme